MFSRFPPPPPPLLHARAYTHTPPSHFFIYHQMSNLHRILLLLASAVCLHAAPPAPASGHDIYKGVKYDYPPQSGFEHINKTDPQRNVLRDGRVGASGAGGVWGAWNKKGTSRWTGILTGWCACGKSNSPSSIPSRTTARIPDVW
ncbi:hypothetical protein Ga0100230_019145 [Opitutaceae bacterium TAV3]|nr:hypothetical protein Ga0100230_019145 [Opitutaceae bacterium TAV3]